MHQDRFAMTWRKITVFFIIILLILVLFAFFAFQKRNSIQRDIPTLFNHYYRFKQIDPWKAKESLDLILAQDPNNLIATQALVDWYIQQGDTHNALSFLQKSIQRFPQDETLRFELAKLYLVLKEPFRAKTLLKKLSQGKLSPVQQKSKQLYESVFTKEVEKESIQTYVSVIPPIKINQAIDLNPLYAQVQQIININPSLAKEYLRMIISYDPKARDAYLTLGYLELKEGQNEQALIAFQKAFLLKADPKLALQIGFSLLKEKKTSEALYFLKFSAALGDADTKEQANRTLGYLNQSNILATQGHLILNGASVKKEATPASVKLSYKDQLLVKFYQTKTSNPKVAWKVIQILLNTYPKDIKILKEAAYFAQAQKKNELAISLWEKIYSLEPKPEYALTLGYLYDSQNKKQKAFYYFDVASKTTDLKLRCKAEMAKTNLAGAQTKILPDPFFIEIYSAPFYFSRFDLAVLPIIARAGITINKEHNTEVYLTNRRTQDDRSGGKGGFLIQNSISQIFEDNVAIYSVGFRTYPWKKIPLLAFIEAGRAQDLIYQNRARWRSDVRGGGVYYNEWGIKPNYYLNLEFPFCYVATLYSDVIYYSRYNDNIIGTAWFRPGLRVAAYHSASLDAYVANYLILDKNHEFYNNTYSIGPGVAFRPTNRLNIVFRFESLQGFYIPVHSPTPNPYRSKYYNNLAMVELFFRF